jgi:competence protein ComEA
MSPVDPLAASRSSRFRVGLGAAVVLVLIGIGVTVLVAALGSGAGHRKYLDSPVPSASAGTPGAGASGGPTGSARTQIYVHVLGAVNRPGLYVLRDGDRAIDAVAAAGGYATDADRRALNLARFLSDGEQIVVPTESETATGVTTNFAGTQGNGGKINLNTADAASLESLPRVGPALAARILAWRDENGRFASIEDLMSVSGIGDKTFAGLKDLVTV